MSRSRVVNLANFQQFTAINVLNDPGHIGGPVVIPNAVKFMIVWGMPDGKTARNVLGMSVGASFAPTPAIAETARAALVAGANWTALAAFLVPGLTLARVELLDIRTPNGVVVASTGAPTAGTSVGTALTDETALAVTLRTNKSGPSGRGRFYVPGWASNAMGTAGIVAAGAVTALLNWAQNNVSNAITGTGGSWVLLNPARASYTGSTGTVHPARTATTVPLTGVLVRDNHWDSQRRRGLK